MMVQWGIEQCDMSGLPIYLQSTISAMLLYEKLGFRAVSSFALDISGRVEDEGVKEYREMSMLYEPKGR